MKRTLLILSLLGLAVTATAQDLKPNDFARGMRLDPSVDRPIHALVLPRMIYQTVTRDDLGDMRVFNGEGEEVPHAVLRADLRPSEESRRALPFFPIYGKPGTDLNDLSVQIRRDASGTLVQVSPPTGNPTVQQLRGYIIDASAVDTAIQQLVFSWPEPAGTFLTEVRVETSDDLRNWSDWGDPGVLASLRSGGNTLRRDALDLPVQEAEYVRLSWVEGEAPVQVSRVSALLATVGSADRQWAALTAAPDEPGTFVYDQEGRLPVDAVRFELPQVNTVAQVTLESSSKKNGQWETRYEGLVYRLRVEGRELSSPPVEFPTVHDRYWRLKVHQTGGGIGRGMPRLELGWTSERLLFVPRGAEPFTLAFGSSSAEPSTMDPEELLGLFPNTRDDLVRTATVRASAPFDLGGVSRLRLSSDVLWRRYLLWGVLVLGVLVLAFMSFRLIRQIDRERESAGAERQG